MASIDIFPWDENFNTGIPKIDEQHQKLVQLLNKLASHIVFHSDLPESGHILDELAKYAVYHFQTEEAIWHQHFPEDSLELGHKETHEDFVATVLKLKADQAHPPEGLLADILSFLTRWLASHILQSDRYMAMVVSAIQSGLPLDQAKSAADERMRGATKVLIDIILAVYGKLTSNSLELIREIDARKKSNQALIDSQKQLKAAIDSTPDMIWSVDAESFGLLMFNRGLSDYFLKQRTIDLKVGMRPEDLFPPGEFVQQWHTFYRRAIHEGPFSIEYQVFAGTRTLQLSFNTLERNGDIYGVSVFGKDVTDQKRTELDLKRSETKFRTLYDSTSDAVWLLDREGFVDCNKAAVAIFGFSSQEQMRGVAPADLSPPLQPCGTDSNVLANRLIATAIELGSLHFEWMHKRFDNGDLFPAEVLLTAMKLDGRTILQAVVRDITERKRAQVELEDYRNHLEELVEQRTAALLETETKASHLLQASADGLYGVDQDGLITFINPAACEMLGYTSEQVIGHSAHGLFHHSKPDGSPYPIESCPSHDAVRRGHQIRVDNEVYWRADGRAIPVMYSVHPMIQAGENTGAVISFVDMSEQQAASLAREQALVAAENLARVRSEFLANMSHEIRTPLNGVLGFAQIGYRNCHDADKARNAFEKILSSGNLLVGVINDILDFSKIEAGKIHIEHTKVSLDKVIDHAIEIIGNRAESKGLAVIFERGANLPPTCISDPLRLSQVLLNILSNAVKFTEAGSVNLSARREGGTLLFSVRDTGIGMNQDQLALLFNPFQQADGSTTRRFGGTGLGLVISRRILELMGGSIQVVSQPGVGSTFEFRIPFIEADEMSAEQLNPHHPANKTELPEKPLKGVRILVAEDDAVNQLFLEENLVEDGAVVVVVSDGLEAVKRVLRDGSRAFDIVLMDIQMPEVDGYEATRRIREVAPDLPIIGQTAHASNEERAKCLSAGMVDHIAKPIKGDALVKLILQHALPRDGWPHDI